MFVCYVTFASLSVDVCVSYACKSVCLCVDYVLVYDCVCGSCVSLSCDVSCQRFVFSAAYLL